MVRKPPSRTVLIIVAALLVASVVWTVLVFTWPAIDVVDRRWRAPVLDPLSKRAQILAAFALLTWPGLQTIALLITAVWAYRRRLRSLAVALALVAFSMWAVTEVMKFALHRPRPPEHLPFITTLGYSYPSGHMVGIVSSCIATAAVLAVTRRSSRVRLAWELTAVVIVIAVGLDRWLLGAHNVSDVIGGALIGGLVGASALIISGVSVPVTHEIVQEFVRDLVPADVDHDQPTPRRCAVIYNPIKVIDWVTFRRRVDYELRTRGWAAPLFLETRVDDPGRAMTAYAVSLEVDLVLGAGGDGTIRVICSGLAGTGIPFGLIPAGTGNLLARNIGIPLDEGEALDVALDGDDRPVDLVQVVADRNPPEHFAVMAGIGIDAAIMDNVSSELKKAVGPAAYFVSAAQQANHPPLHVSIRVDDEPPVRRRAHVILIGNVGLLTGNIAMFPDALPDDGLLDVLVASPRTARDWVRIIGRVVTRQQRGDDQVDRLTGRKVSIRVEEHDQYQLDGDTVGSCYALTAEVIPGALLLRVPRQDAAQRTAIVSSDARSADTLAAEESSATLANTSP